MSDNLGFGRIPDGVATPEVLINAAFEQIDGLFSESLEIDLSTANKTITLENIKAINFISLNGAATDRTVTLPQTKRTIFVKNYGTAIVTLSKGSSSLAIPAGEARTVRLTGTANGLEDIGGGGSGGGSSGVPEAPNDGKQYARQNEDWTEVVASEGGGIEDAPSNGTLYGRKDGAWAAVPASGGGGGGGGGGFMPIKPPAPSLFNRRGGYQFQDIVANERLTSFVRTDNGQYGEQSGAFAGFDIPNSTNWQFDAIIRAPELSPSGHITYGLCLRHATSGKAWIWGYSTGQNTPGLVRLAMNTMTDYNSESSKVVTRQLEFFTVRIARQNDLFQFYRSSDFGLTWIMVMQDAYNNWFTDRPDQLGFCHLHYNSYPSNYMVVPYMNLNVQ